MKLHWSPRSPFVRKVMIVLAETGLTGRVETVRSAVAMAAEPNPAVLADNPLGKIPTLVLGDGTALFDSRLICEYLAEQAPSAGLVPEEPPTAALPPLARLWRRTDRHPAAVADRDGAGRGRQPG